MALPALAAAAEFGSGVEVQSEASTATNVTQPGVLLGTLAYTCPEQLHAEEVDNRSDIFSLVVLYELMAEKHPFRRETVTAMLTAILEDGLPPIWPRHFLES